MNTGLTIIYNSFLYYCCLLFLARYILNCTPKRIILWCSFLAFIPLIIIALLNKPSLLYPTYLVFVVVQFLLIKASFKGIKVRYLIVAYIILYFTNMVFASLIVAIAPDYRYHADYIINAITAILCLIICLTKVRHVVQQVLAWTPKYIMIVSTILLMIASATSVMVSYLQNFRYPEVWSRWISTFIAFLLMAICVIVPIIFIISISNTRLKTLTADYEQQIRAQAEHYKNLAEANYEVRRFRHDFKNIRIAIEKLLAQGSYDEALELIRQCNDSLENPGGFYPVFDTGNGIADALLTDKQEKAVQQNTQIAFQGAIPPEALSPTDLCVILGNSLDNALEACQKLPDRDDKTISVTSNCCGGFLFMSITNPIAEKVAVRDNHIATTKENKTLHGFGLYSLHSIVKKYDGDIQLASTDTNFTISIDLCVMPKVQ